MFFLKRYTTCSLLWASRWVKYHIFLQLRRCMDHHDHASINAPHSDIKSLLHSMRLDLFWVSNNMRSLYWQLDPHMDGIRAQVLTVASATLYRWAIRYLLLHLANTYHTPRNLVTLKFFFTYSVWISAGLGQLGAASRMQTAVSTQTTTATTLCKPSIVNGQVVAGHLQSAV